MPEIKRSLSPRVDCCKIDKVGVHVRRGDYLIHDGCYEILDIDYYKRAMMSFKDVGFLIFSDDIEFCRGMFAGMDVEFSDTIDPVEDLAKMRDCSGLIMANSSFSWWGGMLNSGAVVAPKRWFGPKLQHFNIRDLIYPTWVQV